MEKKVKIALLFFLIVLILWGIYALQKTISLEAMKEYVASYQHAAPLVLLILIIVASTIGFIFQIPVALAGLLLDFNVALIVSIIGLALGAAISFSIARLVGRDYIEKRYISKIKKLHDYDYHLTKHGFMAILFFRIITIIPYELVNIAGGFSKVKFSSFFFGTIIGIIPGTLVTLFFAHSANDLFSGQFFLAAGINLAFSIVPLCFKRVRRIIFYAE